MKIYSFRKATEYIVKLKKPKFRNGLPVEIERKYAYKYYGVISPFAKDPMIMSTENKKEAILHTEKELRIVSHILNRSGISYRVYELDENNKFQQIDIALYEK